MVRNPAQSRVSDGTARFLRATSTLRSRPPSPAVVGSCDARAGARVADRHAGGRCLAVGEHRHAVREGL
jgi:hypothetical protein